MIGIGVETDERLVGRRRSDGGPWVGDRLEQPDEQRPSSLGLEVGVAVGVTKDRPFSVESVDRFGDDVVVVRGVKRNLHPLLGGEVASP